MTKKLNAVFRLSALTDAQLIALRDADAALQAAGLPTYVDLAAAFLDVADGQHDHDLTDGMNKDDADHVCNTRAALRSLWVHFSGPTSR